MILDFDGVVETLRDDDANDPAIILMEFRLG